MPSRAIIACISPGTEVAPTSQVRPALIIIVPFSILMPGGMTPRTVLKLGDTLFAVFFFDLSRAVFVAIVTGVRVQIGRVARSTGPPAAFAVVHRKGVG